MKHLPVCGSIPGPGPLAGEQVQAQLAGSPGRGVPLLIGPVRGVLMPEPAG